MLSAADIVTPAVIGGVAQQAAATYGAGSSGGGDLGQGRTTLLFFTGDTRLQYRDYSQARSTEHPSLIRS